jgi:putative addiction module killer protein
MVKLDIEIYQDEAGYSPFAEWFQSIKDKKAQTLITARISRAALGNFGDWKALQGTKGLCELRIQYGPGFRIYYSVIGNRIVLLLAGSTTQRQDREIENATQHLSNYYKRLKQ